MFDIMNLVARKEPKGRLRASSTRHGEIRDFRRAASPPRIARRSMRATGSGGDFGETNPRSGNATPAAAGDRSAAVDRRALFFFLLFTGPSCVAHAAVAVSRRQLQLLQEGAPAAEGGDVARAACRLGLDQKAFDLAAIGDLERADRERGRHGSDEAAEF